MSVTLLSWVSECRLLDGRQLAGELLRCLVCGDFHIFSSVLPAGPARRSVRELELACRVCPVSVGKADARKLLSTVRMFPVLLTGYVPVAATIRSGGRGRPTIGQDAPQEHGVPGHHTLEPVPRGRPACYPRVAGNRLC